MKTRHQFYTLCFVRRFNGLQLDCVLNSTASSTRLRPRLACAASTIAYPTQLRRSVPRFIAPIVDTVVHLYTFAVCYPSDWPHPTVIDCPYKCCVSAYVTISLQFSWVFGNTSTGSSQGLDSNVIMGKLNIGCKIEPQASSVLRPPHSRSPGQITGN